jgi:SAM-dependent methyltransferase
MDEYAAFAAIYDDWASHMTEDVPFYLELVREADGPVVELAVGNGRVAVPIAQETGKTIIGIDRSPAMLALAKEKAAEADVELELHEGDMRDFLLDEPAALVYCPFRAMLHLPTWSDKRRVFERVAARSLRAAASSGTRSSSTRASRQRTTACGTCSTAFATGSTTSPPTIGSTSRSSPAAASRSGG